jgi:hypothetical protein
MKYLNFENQEKGYKEFQLTRENVLANIGKTIVYLRKGDVDKYRGYAFPKYGILISMKYSTIYLENFETIDKRDIIECGIKI